jgi:hypothetical protein
MAAAAKERIKKATRQIDKVAFYYFFVAFAVAAGSGGAGVAFFKS